MTDRKGDILGATIVGAGAGEMIAAWTLAITPKAQYPRLCRPDRALSDLWGGGKTRRHDIFHAGFDE